MCENISERFLDLTNPTKKTQLLRETGGVFCDFAVILVKLPKIIFPILINLKNVL